MLRESQQIRDCQNVAVSLSLVEERLALSCLVAPRSDALVEVGFASDLLSDVLARAPEGSILVTLQNNLNVIAVAVHARLSAVIFASGHRPDEEVLTKARENGIGLYASNLDTFDIVGKLYQLGLKGRVA